MLRRSLMLVGPRQLAWVEEELPPLGRDDVLLRTRLGAISIGTEMPLYLGQHRGTQPPVYPIMTGYESLADVIACGSSVSQFRVGDRVVAFYGHRTAAALPARRVIGVPPGIPAPLALLVILACDTAKGVVKCQIQPDEAVLITGAGTIGLLTLFNLKHRGVQSIDIVDPVPQRRELALQLGARRALPTRDTSRHSTAYQAGFECSSRNAAFDLLQQRVERGGRICVLADGNVEPLVLSPAFHEKEQTVIGSSDGLDYQAYATWFFEHAPRAAYVLQRVFELETSADELPHVFSRIANAELRPLKALVRYQNGNR